jgi:hypothetical protein
LEIKSDSGTAMRKTTRPHWFCVYIVHVFLSGVILAGCGGEESAAQLRPAAATAAVGGSAPAGQAGKGARDPISQNGKAPAENKNHAVISSPEELTALSKLRALPLLAPLSDKETTELLRRTRALSPSGRLTIINNYSALATLTNQQKQQLLNQIENIVPVTIPSVLLICDCGNDIHPRLCVPETCSDRSEIQSLCNQACGTLPAFRSQCMTEIRC